MTITLNKIFPLLVLLFFASTSADPVPEKNIKNKSDWKKGKLSVFSETFYYNWKSDAGAKGNQIITPLTATYKKGQAEFGLRTAWIESENKTPNREGKVSTLTDTALSASYIQQKSRGINIRYNLDYNSPTGKASLNGIEKNAIMDGNLVQQVRFGEGHNITPGVVITKILNPKISIGVGLSHTIRGEYDPNSDVENDELNPGDETRLTFQSQYGNKKLRLIGGLIFTKSGTTTFNKNDYFQKGDRTDLNITSIHILPKNQSITAGFRYSEQSPDTYVSSISGNFEKESKNINGDSNYLSLQYAKSWKGKHTIKLKTDWLKIKANSYDQFNDLYNAGREKKSIGIAYDYLIDRNSRLSLGLNKFKLDDKATPATLIDTTYRGETVFASYNYKF